MGKYSTEPGIMRKIRTNVRRNNYRAVAKVVKDIINMDDENPDKSDLMDQVYRDVIEPWVRGENVEQEVPEQYEEMFVKFARQFDKKDDQEKILSMLDRIKDSKSSYIRKKVKRQMDLMELTQELLKDGDIDLDVVEKSTERLEENTEGRDYVDVIHKLFGMEIPIEILNVEQLKSVLGEGGRSYRGNGPKDEKEYPDEIKVDKRLKFLIEELDVEPKARFAEKGIFSGSILLNIKNSDMVIVERLFEIYEDGTFDLANHPNAKASATYILPENKVLDMINAATRKSVRKELEKETDGEGLGVWKPIAHSIRWKERVKERIENALKLEHEESNPLVDRSMEYEIDLDDPILPEEKMQPLDSTSKVSEGEELSTEQLEEQLKKSKANNAKKAEELYRISLLAQIEAGRQKGLELDKQIKAAKRNIGIGE